MLSDFHCDDEQKHLPYPVLMHLMALRTFRQTEEATK